MDNSKQSPVLPREVENIGNVAFMTLYGLHTDNKFLGVKSEGFSTSASSGSITLPNAQGYIVVRVNGILKKIPYYNL